MRHRAWGLMIIAAAAAIAGTTHEGTARPAKGKAAAKASAQSAATAPFTKQELDDLEWMRQNTRPGIPYELDLSHPVQYRFVMSMFRRGGERAPRLFRLLTEKSRSGAGGVPKIAVKTNAGGMVDAAPQALAYVTLTAGQPRSYRAAGLLSVYGGTASSVIAIALVAGNQTYATKSGSQSGQGTYFTVPVSGTLPAGVATTQAMATFAYMPKGGNAPIVTYYAAEATINPAAGCLQRPNYCKRNDVNNCISGQYQTACTNTVTNTTPIKVCYARGQQFGCDYWFPGPGRPTNFVFPLQGYAQFDRNISLANNQPSAAVTITLENPTKGGGCYLVLQQNAPLGANWTVSPGTQLNWNFAPDALPDPNNCLEFYGGANTYLHVSVSGLAMQDGTFGQVSFTSDRSQTGQPGIYVVPQMQILQ